MILLCEKQIPGVHHPKKARCQARSLEGMWKDRVLELANHGESASES